MNSRWLQGTMLLAAAAVGNAATFDEDVAFLRQHTDLIMLSDPRGTMQVALAPAWQGRVMTSTAQAGGRGFGWINRQLIASGKIAPHINAYGGEDRLWLGPEGGPFGLYFAPGVPFDLEHWFVPKAFDTMPYEMVKHSADRAAFKASFELTNYAGTHFQVALTREVHLLRPAAAWKWLSLPQKADLSMVAYESVNTLANSGAAPWTKDTGLLSIWILGMFNPSPGATVVVPIKAGPEAALGPRVTSNYFGEVPADRLKVGENAVFLRGDGQFRSKIGVNPRRSLGKLGSYDADHQMLTIVQFNQPQGVEDYMNSSWTLKQKPFAGDVINSYNDGPPTPGAPQLGPFFELETSSPAAALAPGEKLEHRHRTFHFSGPEAQLDAISRAVLGVSLADIKSALQPK